jgi:hypothetical protein
MDFSITEKRRKKRPAHTIRSPAARKSGKAKALGKQAARIQRNVIAAEGKRRGKPLKTPPRETRRAALTQITVPESIKRAAEI